MGNLPGLNINLWLRLSRPKPTSWFDLQILRYLKAFKALQGAHLQAPTLSLPTGSEFSFSEKRLWPHSLREIAAIVLLMPKVFKLTNGQNFTVLTSHDVSGILNSKVQSNNAPPLKLL